MKTQVALRTENAARIGTTNVTLQAMYWEDGSSLSLRFATNHILGMELSFHGSTEEVRAFAAELIRHADAAEAALREVQA